MMRKAKVTNSGTMINIGHDDQVDNLESKRGNIGYDDQVDNVER